MVQKIAAAYLGILFTAWVAWAVSVNGLLSVAVVGLWVLFITSILFAIVAVLTDY